MCKVGCPEGIWSGNSVYGTPSPLQAGPCLLRVQPALPGRGRAGQGVTTTPTETWGPRAGMSQAGRKEGKGRSTGNNGTKTGLVGQMGWAGVPDMAHNNDGGDLACIQTNPRPWPLRVLDPRGSEKGVLGIRGCHGYSLNSRISLGWAPTGVAQSSSANRFPLDNREGADAVV